MYSVRRAMAAYDRPPTRRRREIREKTCAGAGERQTLRRQTDNKYFYHKNNMNALIE